MGNKHYERVYHIPGHSFISPPRLSGKGGGVGVYIVDSICCERRFDLESEKIESNWQEIRPKH